MGRSQYNEQPLSVANEKWSLFYELNSIIVSRQPIMHATHTTTHLYTDGPHPRVAHSMGTHIDTVNIKQSI